MVSRQGEEKRGFLREKDAESLARRTKGLLEKSSKTHSKEWFTTGGCPQCESRERSNLGGFQKPRNKSNRKGKRNPKKTGGFKKKGVPWGKGQQGL